MHSEFDPGLVEVLVIDVKNMEEGTSGLAEEHGLSMPVLLDNKRVAYETYDITYTPTTVIIDRSGMEVFRHVGFSDGHGAMLQREVRLLLERPLPGSDLEN